MYHGMIHKATRLSIALIIEDRVDQPISGNDVEQLVDEHRDVSGSRLLLCN
jgi:hypothetical protein